VLLAAGAVIADKLRLSRKLGQGGMGVVWEARHLTLDTLVAVKLIRPERVLADPVLLARFEREARATARIAHPHVVKVMDYGTLDGVVPYLVMELLGGFSLAELLEKGGRLSVSTARSLVHQVAGALGAAHEAGIIHRDIKPHNVFITGEAAGYPVFVKVLDFGVAKMLGDSQVPGADAALTQTGTVIGSPPYMSPEQIEGHKDADLRSDLWSLGVILYESLTGALPFQGGSFVSVGSAILRGKYTPASELRPSLGRAIDDWFAKALSVDPEGRFQSAEEMAAAFPEDLGAADAPPSVRVTPASAFATTVHDGIEAVARPEVPEATEPPEETADHAPVAERPLAVAAAGDVSPDPEGASAPPRPENREKTKAWRWVAAAGAGLVAIAGGVFVRARVAAPAGCPKGMVLVPGATYRMGSAADAETPSDETPPHPVTVKAFCLDVTEVRVKDYSACADCEKPLFTVELEGLTPNGRSFESQFCNRGDTPDHPMNCVDWHQASAYCKALGRRLPTESEWELAARGEEARPYPWGKLPPSVERLNACGKECSLMLTEKREAVGKGPWPAMYGADDSAPRTSPVGRYPAGATPLGVLDLAGNVWEWTESPYCPYGKEDCGDSRRVLRGGGWDTIESLDVRAARRYPSAPTARGRSIGFRCAKTL
jgi:formylglycine-generating enzyme required for sulfatase activity